MDLKLVERLRCPSLHIVAYAIKVGGAGYWRSTRQVDIDLKRWLSVQLSIVSASQVAEETGL